MEAPLISQSCYIRKPVKPRKGNCSSYAEIWDRLERKVCEFHVTKHQKLIDAVCDYIKNAQNCQDIRTATLRFGSNVSDQSGIFVELSSQLTETSQLICRLAPLDCGSLSTILQKLFHDFIDSLCVDEDAPKLKKSLVTFENLVQLFNYITKRNEDRQLSPRKRRNTAIPSVNGTKLIIIIEDVTAVKPSVLEDFCLIIKSHLQKMETCLIFGMSSTAQSIHRILSFKCSSCLSIQTFVSPPVPETLAGIFELLVLNRDFPFKLSPKVFNWLSDFVLYHDFSLNTLLHILRVALTIHLQGVDDEVIKALCDPGSDDIVDAALLDHHDTDLQLEELAKAYVAMESSRAVVFKDCYLALQEPKFSETSIFKKVEQTIKFLSTEELLHRLQGFIEDVEQGTVADKFVDFCERLLQENLEENMSEENDTNFANIKSRSELQDKLRLAALKKRTTKLDLVKRDLVQFLKEATENLDRPLELSFYKDIYITNLKELESMFAPSVRSRVHRALSNPSVYLKCSCCHVKPNELKYDLPAISVAYKLHLECGKMINTYDWLQSFQVVKDSTSDVTVAQLLRSVRELQLLGYVKQTTRKTDHCQRLTWGSR